jgi:hypothetical protein
MITRGSKKKFTIVPQLRSGFSGAPQSLLSRSRVRKSFEEAPLIRWDQMSSPLGPLFALEGAF